MARLTLDEEEEAPDGRPQLNRCITSQVKAVLCNATILISIPAVFRVHTDSRMPVTFS